MSKSFDLKKKKKNFWRAIYVKLEMIYICAHESYTQLRLLRKMWKNHVSRQSHLAPIRKTRPNQTILHHRQQQQHDQTHKQ